MCQWLFEQVAGVSPQPGFDVVDLAPTILPALSPVSAWHQCRHGRITAGWRQDGARVSYDVTLPAGVSGLLRPDAAYQNYQINGVAVSLPDNGLPLPSGQHQITFDLKT